MFFEKWFRRQDKVEEPAESHCDESYKWKNSKYFGDCETKEDIATKLAFLLKKYKSGTPEEDTENLACVLKEYEGYMNVTETKLTNFAHSRLEKVIFPMAAKIVNVNVMEEEPVRKGQVLAIFSAMKMELELVSPSDGYVHEIFVAKGDRVEANQVAVTIEVEEEVEK